MKLYLAGPMSGIPFFNFPLFNEIATRLREAGHQVFNPAERDIERHGGVDISAGNVHGDIVKSAADHGFSLDDALADDTNFICKQAEGIVLLPGWEYSNGALAEWFLARALGKARPFVFIYILKHEDRYVITSAGEA
jgi:hypothetical protein